MKYLYFLVLVTLLSCHTTGKKDGDSSSIRFDGIYKSGEQTNIATGDHSTSYLRFYKDGTVINVSSSGTPEQISKWFVKGHENVIEAPYTIDSNNIKFTAGGNANGVEYTGKVVNSESLQMHSKALSNNNESDVTYSFVAD